MATRAAHLLVHADGRQELVVDAGELAALQATTPQGAFLRAVTALRDDGLWYVVGDPVETFTAAKDGSRKALRAAALAKLTPEERAALGLP